MGRGRKDKDEVFEAAPCGRNRPTTLCGLKSPVKVGLDGSERLWVNNAAERNSFSGVLCFTVPQHILAADATCWGDLDRSHVNYRLYHTAFSFFLFAIHALVREEHQHVRVFVEAVVHKPGTLPNQDDPYVPNMNAEYMANTIFPANNMAGFRIFVCLPHSAPHAESVFRRAIFRVQKQLLPDSMPEEVFLLKVLVASEVRKDIRESDGVIGAAVSQLCSPAKEKKGGRRKRGKRGGRRRKGAAVDDEAAEGGDEEEDDAEVEGDGFLSKETVLSIIRDPPSPEMMTVMKSHRIVHECNDYLRVRTVSDYANRVLTMMHQLIDAQKHESNLHGAAELIEDDFGESADLRDANEERLGAYSMFGLKTSMSMFVATKSRGAAARLQTDPRSYGLSVDMQGGELLFPYPHLVWEVGSHQLHPSAFLSSRFPWTPRRFEDEAQQYIQEAARQDARRRSAAADLVAMATETKEDRYASAMMYESTTSSHAHQSEGQLALLREHRAAIAMNDAGIKDNYSVYSDEERLAAVIDSNNRLADADRHLVDQCDGNGEYCESAIVRTISEPIIPVMHRFREIWVRASEAISRLLPDENEDVSARVWREEKLNALHALYRQDLQNQLLGAICRGKNVPNSHRSMYQQLSDMGRFSAYYSPAWTPDRNMSVVACASIQAMSHLSLALNLTAGVVQMDETINCTVLQAMDPELQNPLNSLTVGAAGTGKSNNAEKVAEAALPSAFSTKNHTSKAADFVANDPAFNQTNYSDEARIALTDYSRSYQMRNQEELMRTKIQMSSNEVAFDRYVTGPNDSHRDSEKQSVVAWKPANFYANTNVINVDEKSETALLDRNDVVLYAPFAENAASQVSRLVDTSNTARNELWIKLRDWIRREMAIKAFWVILARAQVLHINMDVAELMMRESLDHAMRYMPCIGNNMRAAGRNTQATSMILLRSAYYQLMHSETSPLAVFKNESQLPEDHNLRDLYEENHAYLHEMAEVAGPYLYSQWDHGCWLLTRTVRTAMPFNMWMIVRMVAAVECGFRRSEMASIYREHGVDLVDDDVAKHMARREEDARGYPLFALELLRREAMLDRQVRERDGQAMPMFASCNAGFEDVRDNAGGAAGSMTDPNYVEIPGTVEQVAQRVVGYISSLYVLEIPQIASVFNLLKKRMFRVPIFKKIQRVPQFVTRDMLEFRTTRDYIDGKPVDRIMYEHRSAVTMRYHNNQPSVRILTGALMIPPHLLLLLLLTSAENDFTRSRNTTLPLEVENHPELMHEWRISRQPGRRLASVDYSLPIQQVAETFASTHATVELTAGDNSTGTCISVHMAAPQRVVDRDPEQAAYERHMHNLHQMPSYQWMLEFCSKRPGLQRIVDEDRLFVEDGEWPTERQYDCMFKLWIHTKSARPGGGEHKREHMYTVMSHFKDSISNHTAYPEAAIADFAVQTHLRKMAEIESKQYRPKDAPITRIRKRRILKEEMPDEDDKESAVELRSQLAILTQYDTDRMFVLALAHWLLMEPRYAQTMRWLGSHSHYQARLAVEWLVFGSSSITGHVILVENEDEEKQWNDAINDNMRLITRDSQAYEALRLFGGNFRDHLERWLDLLSEWWSYHQNTRRVALAMVHDPKADVLGASAMIPFNSWQKKEHKLDAKRKSVKAKLMMGCRLTEDDKKFWADYSEAKDAVRPVRINFLHNTMNTYKSLVQFERNNTPVSIEPPPPAVASVVRQLRSMQIDEVQPLNR